MGTIKQRLNISQDAFSVIIFFLVLAVVIIVFSLSSDVFFTLANFTQALKHLSTISLAALGLTFVVAVGHSDMSFHFVSCFAGMTMSYYIGRGLPPFPSIVIGLAGGLTFGLISGYAVGKFKLPDMIVTIAIGSTAWGLAYLYSNGNYIYQNFLTSGIITFTAGRFYGIPYPVIYLFTFYILGYILLHMTVHGRRFYATGSNTIAAAFSGVKVEAYVIAAFAICSFTASFANIMLTTAQGNGNVKGGLVLLMPAWAAVFVGISVFRKPTVIGTFFGAFLIAIMQNGFTLLNAPFYIMDLIVGLTLIGAILISKIQIRHTVESTDDVVPGVEALAAD